MKFTIKCEMKDRWIPHFLAMLRYMEQLGKLGGSRMVSFYSDGDGDFRPKFTWNRKLPSDGKPIVNPRPRINVEGDRTYDAG